MKPVNLLPDTIFSSTQRNSSSYKKASALVYVYLKYGFLVPTLTPPLN